MASAELHGPESPILVPSRVLRCRSASLGEILKYQGACTFKRPLTLPELTARRAVRREVHIARPAAAPNIGWQKVIARFIDGRIVAGYTNDFHPTKQQLHLFPNPRQGESTFIPLTGLKALFFVREFSGDPTLIESKVFLIRRRGARSKSRSTTTRSWWDRHSVIAATATDSSCTRPTVDRTTCVYS